jgi:hypothetical protein
VTLEFDKENVAPFFTRQRKRLDPGEIEFLALWDGKCVSKSTWTVFDFKHQSSFVSPGPFGVCVADNSKTGCITCDILNVFSQYG